MWAKFLSVDPLTSGYPWYTPYQFAGNKPIWAIDRDGLEETFATTMLMDDLDKLAAGKIDASSLEKRNNARALGVLTGIAIVAAVETGAATGGRVILSAMSNPVAYLQFGYSTGTFVVGFFDEGNQVQFSASPFDELGRGTRILVGRVVEESRGWFDFFNATKKVIDPIFSIPVGKFDFFLNRTAGKSKSLVDLSIRDVENLSKSEFREKIFKKIGFDSEEKITKVATEAFETGESIFGTNKHNGNVVLTKIFQHNGETIHFNFEKVDDLFELKGITFPKHNKDLDKYIKARVDDWKAALKNN